MRNSRSVRPVLGLFVALGLVAAACGNGGDDDVAESEPSGTTATDEGTTATDGDEMVAVPCEELSVAALAHFIGPYTQQLMDGARAAADECGASFQDGAPAAFDTQASLQQFNDVLTGGVDAVVVVAFPQDVWIRPIDDAVNDGTVSSAPTTSSLRRRCSHCILLRSRRTRAA